MCELRPYPWNPWIEIGGKLKCQFCEANYDYQNPINAHNDECGWKKRWVEHHWGPNLCGDESLSRNRSRQLLQE